MFGLPVHINPLPGLSVRVPSGMRAAGLVGAAMLLATIWGALRKNRALPLLRPPDNKPAEFVGSTTCQMCHEDIFNAFQKNPHQVVETDKKRGWDTKACESCHGPGSKHAESAVRRRYQTTRQVEARRNRPHLPHLPSKSIHPRRTS